MSGEELLSTNESTSKIGQKLEIKPRTEDIRIDEDVSFSALNLDSRLLRGLHKEQFNKPSPIQLAAIPVGRCGVDLVVQAKSGTGKTAVFAILALEAVDVSSAKPQVLMLAPTREIALQIAQVVTGIGCELKRLVCHCSIGGVRLREDKRRVNKAHIVIGTPGRVKQLMELSVLDASHVRLFVLDEADKLLEESFQHQMNWIYNGLPDSKRVIAASATYKEKEVEHLRNYMQDPICVRLNSSDPVLLGVRQYKKLITSTNQPNAVFESKVAALIDVLSCCQFQQCLVFSNLASRAANLSMLMVSKGWPATHIAGSLEQQDRTKAISSLQSYECRVLISTDLTSRGIDASRIDLVINLDLPYDCETYLHRVGRCGRFGAKGAAITIISQSESAKLDKIAEEIKTEIPELPDEPSTDIISNPSPLQAGKMVQVQVFKFEDQFNTLDSVKSAHSHHQLGADNSSCLSSQSDGLERVEADDCVSGVDDQVDVNGVVEDGLSLVGSVQDETGELHEVTTPSGGITSTQRKAVKEDEQTVGSVSGLNEGELVQTVNAENVGHRPPFFSLGDARKFLENPALHWTMLDTAVVADVQTNGRSMVESHDQHSTTGVVSSTGVVYPPQPEQPSTKPKGRKAVKSNGLKSTRKSRDNSHKSSSVSSCPPPDEQCEHTTPHQTDRTCVERLANEVGAYGADQLNPLDNEYVPDSDQYGYHGMISGRYWVDTGYYNSCELGARGYNTSTRESHIRHTDRPGQALSTHYRLVYMQHSYIRAMAARDSVV